jgi:uncharacterized membrane protein YbaN (DUF454 family)
MRWLVRRVRRIFIISLGLVTILLGIVGLFVPVLQGVLFILVGLYLLSRESRIARCWLERLRERFPRVNEKLIRIRGRFSHRRTSDQNELPTVPEPRD